MAVDTATRLEMAVTVIGPKHIDDETSTTHNIRHFNNIIIYVIFAAYSLWLYALAQSKIFELDRHVVPTGDAFTYTVFLYRILNKAHAHLMSAFSFILTDNYNW